MDCHLWIGKITSCPSCWYQTCPYSIKNEEPSPTGIIFCVIYASSYRWEILYLDVYLQTNTWVIASDGKRIFWTTNQQYENYPCSIKVTLPSRGKTYRHTVANWQKCILRVQFNRKIDIIWRIGKQTCYPSFWYHTCSYPAISKVPSPTGIVFCVIFARGYRWEIQYLEVYLQTNTWVFAWDGKRTFWTTNPEQKYSCFKKVTLPSRGKIYRHIEQKWHKCILHV